ncbi:MAG: hypothetical protein PVG60_10290, partial [Desulfarculaceae bacterium]
MYKTKTNRTHTKYDTPRFCRRNITSSGSGVDLSLFRLSAGRNFSSSSNELDLNRPVETAKASLSLKRKKMLLNRLSGYLTGTNRQALDRPRGFSKTNSSPALA